MDKKAAAHILYDNGLDLGQIAKMLKTPKSTIARYSSDGKWKRERERKSLLQQTSQERIWALIEFQLQIIEKITLKHREVLLSDDLDVAGLQKLLISKGDIDALQKLHTTIRGKDITWDHMVKLFREFLEFMEKENLSIAKSIVPFTTDFLNYKREQL